MKMEVQNYLLNICIKNYLKKGVNALYFFRFDSYPYYAIEFDRFCKVVHHCGIQLSYDDIHWLG